MVGAGFGAAFALASDRRVAVIAMTNGRFSAPMMATQNILEVLSGKEPSVLDARMSRVSPADSADVLGQYTALADTLGIETVDHRLSLVRGTRSHPLVQRPNGYLGIPDHQPYLAPSPTPLELVRDGRGRVAFLPTAWRLYRRVEESGA